jgi:hypothetical protein
MSAPATLTALAILMVAPAMKYSGVVPKSFLAKSMPMVFSSFTSAAGQRF